MKDGGRPAENRPYTVSKMETHFVSCQGQLPISLSLLKWLLKMFLSTICVICLFSEEPRAREKRERQQIK